MKHLVFVYGSLLAGLGNHRLLRDSGARLVCEASTGAARFTMLDLGAFPGVVEGGDQRIAGEIYEVSDACFARLDQLEGYPHFYTRKRVRTSVGVRAWIYLLANPRCRSEELVPAGQWRAHFTAKQARVTRHGWERWV